MSRPWRVQWWNDRSRPRKWVSRSFVYEASARGYAKAAAFTSPEVWLRQEADGAAPAEWIEWD